MVVTDPCLLIVSLPLSAFRVWRFHGGETVYEDYPDVLRSGGHKTYFCSFRQYIWGPVLQSEDASSFPLPHDNIQVRILLQIYLF